MLSGEKGVVGGAMVVVGDEMEAVGQGDEMKVVVQGDGMVVDL